MGIWDFYFIAKLFLYFGHYIGFHLVANLVFLACLLVPLKQSRLELLRQVLAIPFGIALFYYDSWLPPFSHVVAQASQLEGFDLPYLWELFGRFFSLPVVATLAVLYVVYYFTEKVLRVSTFIIIAMLLTLVPGTSKTPVTTQPTLPFANTTPLPAPAEIVDVTPAGPPSDAELTTALTSFYKREATRSVSFTPPPAADAPFDVIFIHICSLSWDDLDFVKETDNPLFKRFNVIFTNFSSAASYSGPAVIRLLRGSIGQQQHKALYDPPLAQSLTFDNLQQLGFEPQFAMNHDGHFGNMLADINVRGGLKAPLFQAKGAAPYLQSFDGSPVYDDYTVLSQWWEQRLKAPAQRVALFYNTISLHDGNRYSGSRTSNSLEIYRPRLIRLLDDLDRFFNLIQSSGRRAVVVFVPEHGASIRGDKMQIAGLREIPSPRISIVPVGIKLIGRKEDPAAKPLVVSQPSSYLAISKLLAGLIEKSPFNSDSPGMDEYVRDLPSTEFVAENADVVVMRYAKEYYMRSKDTAWVKYDPTE